MIEMSFLLKVNITQLQDWFCLNWLVDWMKKMTACELKKK